MRALCDCSLFSPHNAMIGAFDMIVELFFRDVIGHAMLLHVSFQLQ